MIWPLFDQIPEHGVYLRLPVPHCSVVFQVDACRDSRDHFIMLLYEWSPYSSSQRKLSSLTPPCGLWLWGHIPWHSVEAGTYLTTNGEDECPIHHLEICFLIAPKLSVALHGSHLANTQININNSVIDMYNGIIRNFCKHRSEVWKFRAFRDLKWNQNYFDIDQYYLTLTRRYSNLLNTLDIDLVPPYSTRHLNFGSTGIDNAYLSSILKQNSSHVRQKP